MTGKIKWFRAVSGILAVLAISLACPIQVQAQDQFLPMILENLEVNGFIEIRAGYRTGHDEVEEDLSVMDTRLQLELFTFTEKLDFKYKADVIGNGITDQAEYDTREAWVFTRVLRVADLKIGRQVLTWGTGDLLFLNDLFPKDWQSFFIGRDNEYLKAPSDAVKCSFFTNFVSIDLVYTPQFDPDRYVTGEYLSHWSENTGRITGRGSTLSIDSPDKWFEDDEIALRIYQNISNYEFALYGYSGFWKTPSGSDEYGKSIFPGLDVYGASIRGQIGPGIGNFEIAWYDSKDDPGGTDPLVVNSQIRYLAGYTQDLAQDFNVSLQYYVEQILDYDEYEKGLTTSLGKDRLRHVITAQFTKLLMHQTLTLSLSAYVSPTDKDAYLRPMVNYKYTDNLVLETGANIFLGSDTHTFFTQFENNTNVYAAIRYHF